MRQGANEHFDVWLILGSSLRETFNCSPLFISLSVKMGNCHSLTVPKHGFGRNMNSRCPSPARTPQKKKTGSGLSIVEACLRLRYELRREIAPCLGAWTRLFGKTAYYDLEKEDKTDVFQVEVGLRCWL